MMHIELPRALEDYFAYAETDPTRNGRRFTISMPYFEGGRLDRLQWWYHLTADQEQRLGATAVEKLRAQATQRFIKHIDRWLQNTGLRLHGQEPIPRITRLAAAAPTVAAPTSGASAAPATPVAAADAAAELTSTVLPWPTEKVANG
ncbi:MAG: hypothetical protein ABI885_07680 [Gammaproteobacteria bacterium]